MRQAFARKFLEKTRDEWCQILEGSDSCFAPVLSVAEAAGHQQYAARAFFREIDGIVQPGPAPAFSLTMPPTPSPPQTDPYADAAEALGG